MDTYSWLRELADSWVLLAMTGFYLSAILFVFRPSNRSAHAEAANIPLRDDTLPGKSCAGTCASCRSTKLSSLLKPEDA